MNCVLVHCDAKNRLFRNGVLVLFFNLLLFSSKCIWVVDKDFTCVLSFGSNGTRLFFASPYTHSIYLPVSLSPNLTTHALTHKPKLAV